MTKDELIEKYNDLHHKDFMIQMKDHWSSDDYAKSNVYHREYNEIAKELKEKYGITANQWGELIDADGNEVG